MRLALIIAFAAFAASGAQAQMGHVASAGPRPFPSSLNPALGDAHDGPSGYWRASQSDSNVKCLIRKADRRRICHSMRRWREIARAMDGQDQRTP
jgi:hypothetical protein